MLAFAIAQRSRLLILDEPTTGLDPVALDALLRLLVEDCTSDGRTVFLSSHQLNEIEQIADQIGIMDRGRLLLEGKLDDIRARFRRVTVTGSALPQTAPIVSARTCAVLLIFSRWEIAKADLVGQVFRNRLGSGLEVASTLGGESFVQSPL